MNAKKLTCDQCGKSDATVKLRPCGDHWHYLCLSCATGGN